MVLVVKCSESVQTTVVTESGALQHLRTQIFLKSIIIIKDNAAAEVDQEQPRDQDQPGDPDQPGDQDQPGDPEAQPGEGMGGALLPPVITTVFGLVFASKYSTALHLPVVHFNWLHVFFIFFKNHLTNNWILIG